MNPDVLIIGAGVAGISAANWLVDQGFTPIERGRAEVPTFAWVEAEEHIGGILHHVHNPLVQLVSQAPKDGAELVDRLRRQLDARGLYPQLNTRVASMDPSAECVVAHLDSGAVCAAFVIVATGTQRRSLGLAGEIEHIGRGVARSGRAERERFRGRRVVVVGGGDAALENALLLAEIDAQVILVHRQDSFRARASFRDAIRQHPGIELRTNAELAAIVGGPSAPWLDAVVLRDGTRIPTDGLLVRIGVEAQLPTIIGGTMVDGFLGARPHPRILGAGDCICPDFRAVAVAVGQGAQAARLTTVLMGLRP